MYMYLSGMVGDVDSALLCSVNNADLKTIHV